MHIDPKFSTKLSDRVMVKIPGHNNGKKGTVVGGDRGGRPIVMFDGDAPYLASRWDVALDEEIDNKLVDPAASDQQRFMVISNPLDIRSVKIITTPETQMNSTKDASFVQMLKDDAHNAAYRMASTQMTKGVKAAILALMEKSGQGSDRVKAMSEMLDTEIGDAVVSALLGMGLTYAPMIKEDPRAQKLASEFRINGIATAGNAVLGIAMEHFLPVIQNALSALPAAEATTQTRISAPPVETSEEAEEEEETETKADKRMSVGGQL